MSREVSMATLTSKDIVNVVNTAQDMMICTSLRGDRRASERRAVEAIQLSRIPSFVEGTTYSIKTPTKDKGSKSSSKLSFSFFAIIISEHVKKVF